VGEEVKLVSTRCARLPQRGRERWNATKKSEGDDDEEHGEEDGHVVAGACTLPRQDHGLFLPGGGACVLNTTASGVDLNTHTHTHTHNHIKERRLVKEK